MTTSKRNARGMIGCKRNTLLFILVIVFSFFSIPTYDSNLETLLYNDSVIAKAITAKEVPSLKENYSLPTFTSDELSNVRNVLTNATTPLTAEDAYAKFQTSLNEAKSALQEAKSYFRNVSATPHLRKLARTQVQEATRTFQKTNRSANFLSSMVKEALNPTSDLPPRLEFVHIQKNAGSTLEFLALQQNVAWGACHFNFSWKRQGLLRRCPPLRNHGNQSSQVFWHWPLQELEKFSKKYGVFEVHPYDNIWDVDYIIRPKKYFAVVRNPYTRVISLFQSNHQNKNHVRNFHITKNYFNSWIQSVLKRPSIVGLNYENATICQYPFFYDDTVSIPKQMIHHVVQFEHLVEDFNSLALQYGLNMSIPETKVNSGSLEEKIHHNLTKHDLTNKTIHMLNTLCSKDFDLGRGYAKMNVTVLRSKNQNADRLDARQEKIKKIMRQAILASQQNREKKHRPRLHKSRTYRSATENTRSS